MTRFYIEAGAAALLLMISAALGFHFGSLQWKGKYEALVVADAQASASAVAKADQQLQTARDTYDANITAISNNYQQKLVAANTASTDLNRQLQHAASRLSACRVPQSTGTSGATAHSNTGAAEDSGLAAAIDGVKHAVGSLADTAARESAQLTALQQERQSLNRSPK